MLLVCLEVLLQHVLLLTRTLQPIKASAPNVTIPSFLFQDNKLKHMADLQMSVLAEPETKQHINEQITQWEENLERLHCEQFRLRCYMASLQNGELPNPKVNIVCLWAKFGLYSEIMCPIIFSFYSH